MVDQERQRRSDGRRIVVEQAGKLTFATPAGNFVLTAKADLQSMHAGFSVGGVFYLTKPFTRARLLDVVKAVVEMG